ncbi:MAG: FAD-binding oxidoreductase [Saprospiraceae bacterium]|nr:FAD-binding oxidoreductase [Saprospiraceae bacterium]
MHTLSFWERKAYFENVDVTIVGGGLVGLSTGISLLEKNQNLRVLILERHSIPHGASTKNAGFACFGSPSELLDDLKGRPASEVFSLFSQRYRGIQKLIERTNKSQIDYHPDGGYELLLKNTEFESISQETLDILNSGIENVTGLKDYFYFRDDLVEKFGLKGFEGIICNAYEASIDPVKTLNCLHEIYRSMGGHILYGMNVKKWNESEQLVEIQLAEGVDFYCRQMIFCVNGFAKQYFSELAVQAARNSVLILKPSKPLLLKGCFHVDRGYIYFRNIDGNLLIGGGRNWDPEKEYTTEFQINPLIESQLLQFAENHIFQNTNYIYIQNWTGIMGLGSVKSPIIKMISDHIGVAVRLGGMGVALASLVGEEAAIMLLEPKNPLK